MRKYDSYKDSGVEWIGEIPSHWEVKKFGSISYMKGRIGWQGLKQSEFTSNPDDPFLITGMNFHDGKIRWDEVYHILEERYNEAPEIQLKESDVLFTKDGTIGKLLFVDSIPHPNKASLNSHLLVLRPLYDSYKPRFLYYQLKSLPFKHHVELTKTGTTFYGITQEAMGQYRALLPPPIEQTAIATYLDRKTAEIDELIADKNRLLELYEEEKKATINQAVTKGINPDVSMKDSGIEWLGEIPEHWLTKRFKHVSTKIGDGIHTTPSYLQGTEIYFINGVNLNNGEITITGNTLSVPIEEYDKYKIDLKKDSILISLNGTIGKLAFYNNEKVILGKSAAYIELKDLVFNKFMFYVLKSQYINNYFENSFSGTTIKNLSLYTLRNTPFPFMELDEQRVIVQFIEIKCALIDAKKAKTEKLIDLLTEYRKVLISEVVTGKVKIIE